MHLTRALAAIAGLACLAGCGSTGSSSAKPSADQSATAQDSATSLAALDRTTDVANLAIINDGTHGAARSNGLATLAETSFTFSADGSATIDLDGTDGAGHDLYPNASGTFTVTWHGSVVASQPTGSAGVADYAVSVHYDTACVFTDPRCAKTATIAAGATLAYAAELSWNRVSDAQWTVDAQTDHSADGFSLTVQDHDVTTTVAVDGSRHATGHLAYSGGTLSASKTVVAHWTVDITRGAEHHTVVWDRPELNQIWITVDGVKYGPYTLAEARLIVHAQIDAD
jgi:hypothetical protein